MSKSQLFRKEIRKSAFNCKEKYTTSIGLAVVHKGTEMEGWSPQGGGQAEGAAPVSPVLPDAAWGGHGDDGKAFCPLPWWATSSPLPLVRRPAAVTPVSLLSEVSFRKVGATGYIVCLLTTP